MNNRLTLWSVALLIAMAFGPSNAAQESLRDPTRPLSYSATASTGPNLVLQAIFQRQSGREAIVSGESVEVGGTVKGAKIEAINQDSIVYSYNGERQTLRLRPQLRKP